MSKPGISLQRRRRAAAALVVLALAGLSGCSAPTPTPTVTVTVTATPSPTTEPVRFVIPEDCETVASAEVNRFFPGLTVLDESMDGSDLVCGYESGDGIESVGVVIRRISDVNVFDFIEVGNESGGREAPGIGDAAYFTPDEFDTDYESPVSAVTVLAGDSVLIISTELTANPEVFTELAKAMLEDAGYER